MSKFLDTEAECSEDSNKNVYEQEEEDEEESSLDGFIVNDQNNGEEEEDEEGDQDYNEEEEEEEVNEEAMNIDSLDAEFKDLNQTNQSNGKKRKSSLPNETIQYRKNKTNTLDRYIQKPRKLKKIEIESEEVEEEDVEEEEAEEEEAEEEDDESSFDLNNQNELDNLHSEEDYHRIINRSKRSKAFTMELTEASRANAKLFKPNAKSKKSKVVMENSSQKRKMDDDNDVYMDEKNENATTQQLKDKKIQQNKKDSQKGDVKALYNIDEKPMKLASSNKTGKLIDNSTNKKSKMNSNNQSRKKQSEIKTKKSISKDTCGLLKVNQEVIFGKVKYRVTYVGEPCPTNIATGDYDLDHFNFDCLCTIERKRKSDNEPVYQVCIMSHDLPPVLLCGDNYLTCKSQLKPSQELKELAVKYSNVRRLSDGRIQMFLPSQLYGQVAKQYKKQHPSEKKHDETNEPKRNYSELLNSNGCEWTKQFATTKGEMWILQRLQNFCKVGIRSIEDLKDEFGELPSKFDKWNENGGDAAWQAACNEYGAEAMIWFLEMTAYFTDRGRKIVLDRAKELASN